MLSHLPEQGVDLTVRSGFLEPLVDAKYIGLVNGLLPVAGAGSISGRRRYRFVAVIHRALDLLWRPGCCDSGQCVKQGFVALLDSSAQRAVNGAAEEPSRRIVEAGVLGNVASGNYGVQSVAVFHAPDVAGAWYPVGVRVFDRLQVQHDSRDAHQSGFCAGVAVAYRRGGRGAIDGYDSGDVVDPAVGVDAGRRFVLLVDGFDADDTLEVQYALAGGQAGQRFARCEFVGVRHHVPPGHKRRFGVAPLLFWGRMGGLKRLICTGMV